VVYTDIDPEKGHGISISGSYSQEDFALSITPFLTWMDQEIVYDSSQFRNVNMGESLRTGCTFSGKYSHQWLSLSAGYNYTRGVILYGENEANEIPLVSPHVVTGKVSIQLPMGLDIYSQYRFNSPYYQGGDEANDQDLIPGRHDVNLGLSYSILDNFIFRIYGNNLLNDRTPTKVYYNSFSGESAWYPVAERIFGLELTYQF
jgi:outer membrane receptor protein involved in Fe transport